MSDCLKSLMSSGLDTTYCAKILMSTLICVAVSPRGPLDCTMVSHGKVQSH